MKTLTTKLMIAAAALVAAAGTAPAQTMRANVPFVFHISNQTLAPGTYRVNLNTTRGMLEITSVGQNPKTVMSLAYADNEQKRDWKTSEDPMLSFECTATSCVLKNIWMGSLTTYRIPGHTLGMDEVRHMAEVVMHRDGAE